MRFSFVLMCVCVCLSVPSVCGQDDTDTGDYTSYEKLSNGDLLVEGITMKRFEQIRALASKTEEI